MSGKESFRLPLDSRIWRVDCTISTIVLVVPGEDGLNPMQVMFESTLTLLSIQVIKSTAAKRILETDELSESCVGLPGSNTAGHVVG